MNYGEPKEIETFKPKEGKDEGREL